MTSLVFDEPLLDAADEVELAARIEAGVLARAVLTADPATPAGLAAQAAEPAELTRLVVEGEAARQRFLLANLRLVASVVRGWAGRGEGLGDDLFQEGVVVLAECLDRWDHRRGTRFAGYALPSLRYRLAQQAAVRLGGLENGSRVRQVHRVAAEQQRLSQRLGHWPSTAELARALGRPSAWVDAALAAGRALGPDALELVHQLEDGQEGSAGGAAAAVVEATGRWSPADSLEQLDEPHRSVLRARFGFGGPPSTQAALAERLGLSRRRVARLEREGLELLREVCPSGCRPAA